jgi:hypothetical protein
VTTRFTVAIPTRNRSDTLQWALQTCTTQDYDDFEIIVSDNASSDDTKATVLDVADPRIRYVNTGRAVSMSENFEFALSHAGNGYVTFLGDDDGLLPGALAELGPILERLRSKAFTWSMQNYYWPGFFETQLANMLNMSLDQQPRVREVQSATVLREVRGFTTKYTALPSPYFGFVHSDVLEAARGQDGRFFHSITPDIYSGVAVASTIDSFHVSNRAYSLSGQSRHSSGASQVSGASDEDSAAARFVRENTLPFHPELTYSPSIPVLVAETFLQVRDNVGASADLSIDIATVLKAALADQNYLVSPAVRPETERTVRTIASQHGLTRFAEVQIRRAHRLLMPRTLLSVLRLIFVNNPVFDCSGSGARNIYDATLAFRRIEESYPSARSRRVATLLARAEKAKRILLTATASLRKRGASTS